MTTIDLERAAYVAGDIDRAGLLARINDLTEALGRAVAEIEELRDERDALADQLHDIKEGQQ
jgi:cell division protein FtsB